MQGHLPGQLLPQAATVGGEPVAVHEGGNGHLMTGVE